jgi:hypothetical protein
VSASQTGNPTNSKGYYCTQNGSDYPPRNGAGQTIAENIMTTKGDSVGGGAVPGDIRLMASFDYALTTNQMVGGRVGYVLRTYQGSQAAHFAPIHAEARYSYVFGDDPIGKAGIHPMIFGGTGISEFDSSVTLSVYQLPNSANCTKGAYCVETVSAWRTGGPFFLEVGGGGRWEFVPGFAATLDLKLVTAMGGSVGFAFVPTPEAGVQLGF